MKREDKELLLKDLSARLPYEVECLAGDVVVGKLVGIVPHAGEIYLYLKGVLTPYRLDEVKPYLRPMSSMTDRELIEFLEIRGMNLNSEELRTFREGKTAIVSTLPSYSRHIDWLNAHHFDYRGLIEKNLAIAVTKENNPYEI